jgi:hypothetical protein
MQNIPWYQQGDVTIKPVECLPQGGQKVEGAILAEGEATGHQHKAVGDAVIVLQNLNQRYLAAPHGAEVVHPEHNPIRIPPGNYRIDRVREYDHFMEEQRRVTD